LLGQREGGEGEKRKGGRRRKREGRKRRKEEKKGRKEGRKMTMILAPADDASHALRRLSHGVEGEEVVVPYAILLTHEVQSCAQNV
jgi:hypothetical protein